MKKFLIIFLILWCSVCFAKDITLAWDHDGECTEFRIYRSEGEAHWPNRVGTVPCDTLQFTDANIPAGNLGYVVTAWDGTEESNTSNEEAYAYYYALVRFDYDTSGRILYKGENQDISADDSDTDWVVTKYYYDANGMVTEMRVRTTSWTDRATGW
jgi:YD repeat-containing protein